MKTKKQFTLLALSMIGLSACSNTPAKHDHKLVTPRGVVEFDEQSSTFNNVVRMRALTSDIDSLKLVAFADTHSGYALSYRRFKNILGTLEKSAVLYVKPVYREFEKDAVFVYGSGVKLSNDTEFRMMYMPGKAAALDEESYRQFYKQTLRKTIGLSGKNVSRQLTDLFDYWGWTLRLKNLSESMTTQSLDVLELATIYSEPTASELKNMLESVFHSLQLQHHVSVDNQKRIFEVNFL